MLDRLPKARGLTFGQFAIRVGVVRIGVISHAKTTPLSPERIPIWADALELGGSEREQFIELAWLAHAPPFVREFVGRQRAEIAAMAAKKERLRRKRSR